MRMGMVGLIVEHVQGIGDGGDLVGVDRAVALR